MMNTKAYGKKVWLVADGFWPAESNGQPSHEAVCVLNTGDTDAAVTLTLFFEDRPELSGFVTCCPARRTRHIRLDRLTNADGKPVPRGVPYALLLESDVPVVAQYSRLDTTQAELALMTTMAYPVE